MKLKRAGKEATPVGGATEATAKKGGHSNLVPAIVIAVGLLGGGFFMGKSPAAPPAAQAHADEKPAHKAEPEVKEEATHGPVQNLEPITLNLADGHFLKIGLALQLAEAEGGGHGAAEELPSAKALDLAITLLGEKTMDDLASPKARELVKKELSKRVSMAYTDPLTHEPLVTKVYFTEFVMQ
jgi:flagellar FliL protein